MVNNIGVIGAGKIAERHIAAYIKLGCTQLTVFDLNIDAAEALSKRFDIQIARSSSEILDSNHIDIVDICTPVESHKDLILEAVKHDKHVFCEKPLSTSLNEAYQIKGAAENADKIIMVGYLYRFHPAFEKVKEWIDSGLIGKPHFGIFRIGGRGSHQEWKHKLSSGGGAINEMLIHKLDLVQWYMGSPETVRFLEKEVLLKNRRINGNEIECDAEDMVLLDLAYKEARIICEADFVTPVYMEYLEIHGDNGSIFTSILNHLPTMLYLKEPRGIYSQGNNIFNFDQVNLFELEIGHFLDCVKNGTNAMNSIDESINVLNILKKARESSL